MAQRAHGFGARGAVHSVNVWALAPLGPDTREGRCVRMATDCRGISREPERHGSTAV